MEVIRVVPSCGKCEKRKMWVVVQFGSRAEPAEREILRYAGGPSLGSGFRRAAQTPRKRLKLRSG